MFTRVLAQLSDAESNRTVVAYGETTALPGGVGDLMHAETFNGWNLGDPRKVSGIFLTRIICE
ncbi:hypothetical protein GCM10025791_38310 [Halioxenophilus aromaticivorans]|jgi:hypothetical protein|uniref:Uncharacterized protein n=1 Tax=Halioxenophilus aromaticivorans TaxID=1306992 RepID=A0AAV3U6V6_9ALTE